MVVKAQVLIGGRGKAGGVKLADDEAEAREHAGNILGMDIHGHTVRKLWIEHASDIATEYYASVLLDRSAKQPLVMFSTEGGVDIEEVAEKTPEKLVRHHVDALAGLSREEAVQIATDGRGRRGRDRGRRRRAGGAVRGVDAGGRDAGGDQPADRAPRSAQVKALDAKVSLDGNALYRHPENQGLSDAENEDPIERRAKEQGVQYVALDGDIGILGNGAGLVMSTLDVVAQAGGQPANFLDAGGGSDAAKIKQAVELILSNESREGGAVQHLRRDHPLRRGRQRADRGVRGPQARRCPFVVRLDGTNDVAGPRAAERGGAAQRARRPAR